MCIGRYLEIVSAKEATSLYYGDMKHANTSSDPLVQFSTQSGPNLCKTPGNGDVVKTQTQKSDTFHLLSK